MILNQLEKFVLTDCIFFKFFELPFGNSNLSDGIFFSCVEQRALQNAETGEMAAVSKRIISFILFMYVRGYHYFRRRNMFKDAIIKVSTSEPPKFYLQVHNYQTRAFVDIGFMLGYRTCWNKHHKQDQSRQRMYLNQNSFLQVILYVYHF